jgi:predicted transcriptional regulator
VTVLQEHPVTPEWRAQTLFRMAELGLSVGALARELGTSGAAISHVLNKARGSSFVPRIDAFLATAAPREAVRRPPEEIAEIALAREARDAIQDDIVRLEDVRARLEDRLAEAYEHRAMLDLRILTLRSR